jgi:hypothetical protein
MPADLSRCDIHSTFYRGTGCPQCIQEIYEEPEPVIKEELEVVEVPPPRPIRIIGARELLREPLRAPDWLIPALQIGPGRPNIVSGYSYSLKSLMCLQLALAVGSGRPAWGHYETRRSRVLVLDYEGGDTMVRLRRMAAASRLDVDELVRGDALNLSVAPEHYLDDDDAVAWMTRVFGGYGLVVIDSLRQAAPRSDENDSGMGILLARLMRASLATGATVLLVAHSGKDTTVARDPRQQSIRGSSASFGEGGAVYHMARHPRGYQVRQVKRPTGAWGQEAEPLTIRVRDCPDTQIELQDGEGERVYAPGLALDLVSHDRTPPPEGVEPDSLEDDILEELRIEQPLSRKLLAERLGKRAELVGKAARALLEAHHIDETSRGLELPHIAPWEQV